MTEEALSETPDFGDIRGLPLQVPFPHWLRSTDVLH